MLGNENKITVKLKWTLNETKVSFVNKGIALNESLIFKDIYLIKEDVDVLKTSNLQILAQALIIRECNGEEQKKELIYIDKKFDKSGNVIENSKYICPLVDIDKTYYLLTKVGFKECFRYEQECLTYSNNGQNILIEYVPELGLFAKLEGNNKSVDELIKDLNELSIPYYENDYFVKKASLMIDQIKKQRRCTYGRK